MKHLTTASDLGKNVLKRVLRLGSPEWEARAADYYALLQAPRDCGRFRWRPVQRCPEGRLDAAGAAIGPYLFVIAGYASIDRVLSAVDVLDMRVGRWITRLYAPDEMAHSHLAVANDGARHIFVVSGQWGNHCRPAVTSAFALDTATGRWVSLPPLPEPRYAAAAAIWRGRLHVFGGSRADRRTAATSHRSLAVADGRATDASWRPEPPIPLGGPHRACAVIDNRLYVFGGQEGDYIPIPGDEECRCTGALVAHSTIPRFWCSTSTRTRGGTRRRCQLLSRIPNRPSSRADRSCIFLADSVAPSTDPSP